MHHGMLAFALRVTAYGARNGLSRQFSEGDGKRLLIGLAGSLTSQYAESCLGTGASLGDQQLQSAWFAHFLAVQFDDDVSILEADLLGRAIGGNITYNHAAA